MDIEIKQIKVVLLILVTSILIFLFSGSFSKEISINSIDRNEPGDGKKEIILEADIDDIHIEEIKVNLNERKLTKEECEKIAKSFEQEIVKKIFGTDENVIVTKDIPTPKNLSGFPFEITYSFEPSDKISGDGTILLAENFEAEVNIVYSFGDFKGKRSIDIQVNPDENTKKEIYKREIISLIEIEDKKGLNDIKLPETVLKNDLSLKLQQKKRDKTFLFLGPIASALYLIAGLIDKRKTKEERKEAILYEYPVLLQKMALYLASGLTLRNIWEVIYEEGAKKKGKKNPLYEEMGITVNEIQSGVSEGLAYKRFGERTELPELVRFTALLSQNLKKGSSRLKSLLDEETKKAFVIKKQRAIEEGGKAETKLLLPMMLLLVVVLLIIMVPAFWSI